MLKIIICEDNQTCLEKAISATHKALGNYDIDYKICKYLSFCKEFEEDIEDKINKKIYILDIELPEISGLQIADKIRRDDWESIIIFVTSHPECRNDIFYSRLLAFDYISKYTSYDKRLQQSIEEASKIVGKKRVFIYKSNRIIYRLEYNEILYFERINGTNKWLLHVEGGNVYEIGGNTGDIMENLDETFALSHKSCIINLNKIKCVDNEKGILTLKKKKKIGKLSFRKRKDLEKNIMKIR